MEKITLYDSLQQTIRSITQNFDAIPAERKTVLKELSHYITAKASENKNVQLNFICTHNSRRSHISQIWAQAAAAFYGIPHVHCYSGGTEATAFNPRAVRAMQQAGFHIHVAKEGKNPLYEVKFAHNAQPVIAFSKKYDDAANPPNQFAAIMTCSNADENCPVVLGMEKRISLPYDDPKDFDDTPQEAAKYEERVHEIGREVFYAFSQVKL